MLSCKEITATASDYYDKNIPWHRKLSFKLHLLMCKHCSRFMKHFKTAIYLSKTVGSKQANPEETRKVLNQVIDH